MTHCNEQMAHARLALTGCDVEFVDYYITDCVFDYHLFIFLLNVFKIESL